MRIHRVRVTGAILLAAALGVTACGSGGGTKSSSGTTAGGTKGALTVGSFNFSESETLAYVYGDSLTNAGYQVTVKANIGPRETVEPALLSGSLDMVPEYVGNLLTYFNPAMGAGLAGQQTVSDAKTAVSPKGLTLGNVSAAADSDAIAVTKATAAKYHLKKISDLAPVASQLTMGGPPECEARITCFKGLQQVYGFKLKGFVSLSSPALVAQALSSGSVQLARVDSSDADIATNGFVVLTDDKNFQQAGNIIPLIRTDKAAADVLRVLNKVSAALTTDELVTLNGQTDLQHQDPSAVAKAFVSAHHL
ncbi:MAG: ABC transporter substrate-binding protein [Acidimicrobiales bacterium]